MPRVEFDECPWSDYGYRDELPMFVAEDDGPREVDRYALSDIPYRTYTWHLKRNRTERATVDAFTANAHLCGLASFYVRDPADDAQTSVALGVGDGVETAYTLPITGEMRRYYPRDDATVIVRVDGTPVAGTVVDTDARTFTLAAPPGVGLAVEADFSGMRLVRQGSPFDWRGMSHTWYDATVILEEMLRGD